MDENKNNSLPNLDNEGTPTPANEQDADKVPQDLSGVVEELKALRAERRELKEKLEAIENSKKDTGTPIDKNINIEEVVSQVLSKKEQEAKLEQRKQNLANAAEKFKKLYKETNPDNDKDGMVFGIVEKELANYNLTNCHTEDDFIKVFKKAGITSGVIKENIEPESIRIETNTPAPTGGSSKPVDDASALSKEEQALLAIKTDWTKERLLNLRKSMPEKAYIEMVMAHIS